MAISRARMKSLLAQLERPIRQAFEIAAANARTKADIAALTRALIAGDTEAILLAAGIRDAMWSPLTESIRSAYFEAGTFAMAAHVPQRFAMTFDITNPRAESFLRTYSSSKVKALASEQRAAIQNMLSEGFRKGKNPRTIALDIVGRIGPTGRRSGGVIVLTGEQSKYVSHMADDLDELNYSRYKSRRLRDRRFDKLVKRHAKEGKPIPAKTRQKIVDRYSDRMLKHRGDTIARTEALHAMSEAADEAVNQAIDEGLAPRNAVRKVWRHSFGADSRPGHLALNGVERAKDELFVNPVTSIPMKYPHDPAGGPGEVINCRCYLDFRIDFAAVELAA